MILLKTEIEKKGIEYFWYKKPESYPPFFNKSSYDKAVYFSFCPPIRDPWKISLLFKCMSCSFTDFIERPFSQRAVLI